MEDTEPISEEPDTYEPHQTRYETVSVGEREQKIRLVAGKEYTLLSDEDADEEIGEGLACDPVRGLLRESCKP